MSLRGTSMWPWKRSSRFQSVSPWRIRMNSVEVDMAGLHSPRSRCQARDRAHFTENPCMPSLVLLPGLACDERLWEAQRPALPPALAVRVSDAHMRNDRIETMAAAVLADHPGPLILCGASMGGMVAMEVARQAPARIAGLALLGTNARAETPEMFELRRSAIELFENGEARDVIELNAGFAFHSSRGGDRALLRR